MINVPDNFRPINITMHLYISFQINTMTSTYNVMTFRFYNNVFDNNNRPSANIHNSDIKNLFFISQSCNKSDIILYIKCCNTANHSFYNKRFTHSSIMSASQDTWNKCSYIQHFQQSNNVLVRKAKCQLWYLS